MIEYVNIMAFRFNWFDISAKRNFEVYLERFKGKSGLRFLEIGPFEGNATIWLLENILTSNDSNIVCVDTFEGSDEHKVQNVDTKGLINIFLDNISKYRNKVVVIVGKSQEELRKDNIGKLSTYGLYDFVYVDGSHRSPDVLEDAILSFRLLKKGGIMIFDDYKWKFPGDVDDIESPGMAVDAFLSIFRKEYKLLLKEYQVVIEKL